MSAQHNRTWSGSTNGAYAGVLLNADTEPIAPLLKLPLDVSSDKVFFTGSFPFNHPDTIIDDAEGKGFKSTATLTVSLPSTEEEASKLRRRLQRTNFANDQALMSSIASYTPGSWPKTIESAAASVQLTNPRSAFAVPFQAKVQGPYLESLRRARLLDNGKDTPPVESKHASMTFGSREWNWRTIRDVVHLRRTAGESDTAPIEALTFKGATPRRLQMEEPVILTTGAGEKYVAFGQINIDVDPKSIPFAHSDTDGSDATGPSGDEKVSGLVVSGGDLLKRLNQHIQAHGKGCIDLRDCSKSTTGDGGTSFTRHVGSLSVPSRLTSACHARDTGSSDEFELLFNTSVKVTRSAAPPSLPWSSTKAKTDQSTYRDPWAAIDDILGLKNGPKWIAEPVDSTIHALWSKCYDEGVPVRLQLEGERDVEKPFRFAQNVRWVDDGRKEVFGVAEYSLDLSAAERVKPTPS